jgi:hypothetical protein
MGADYSMSFEQEQEQEDDSTTTTSYPFSARSRLGGAIGSMGSPTAEFSGADDDALTAMLQSQFSLRAAAATTAATATATAGTGMGTGAGGASSVDNHTKVH